MRPIVVVGCGVALIACAAVPDLVAPPSARPRTERPAIPTTRLVLPSARDRSDVDCADLPDHAAAQRVLRARPGDPDRLDADHDGIACERLAR